MEQPIVNIVGDRVALGPLRRELTWCVPRWLNDFGTIAPCRDRPRPAALEAPRPVRARRNMSGDSIRVPDLRGQDWRPIGYNWLFEIRLAQPDGRIRIADWRAGARGRGYGGRKSRA